MQDIRVSFQ